MKHIQLENGVALSEISLGAGALGNVAYETSCFTIMDRYIELGGNTFDTARIYEGGNCDLGLGRWVKSRSNRRQITIVTKGSHPDISAMHISRLSRTEIEGDLDASLKAIDTDYTDLHILHRDDVKKPVEEIVDSLDALVRSGKARAVGVSNWTATRIIQAIAYAKATGRAVISCSQAHYSLALTTAPTTGDLTHVPINDIEAGWYKESQLPLMAFSAQARGWFVARASGSEPKDSPKNYYDYLPENHRRLARLQKLSRDTGRSLSALTTAYARDSGLNTSPLCGFSSILQLEDSFAALSFSLTPSQIRFLEYGEI